MYGHKLVSFERSIAVLGGFSVMNYEILDLASRNAAKSVKRFKNPFGFRV